MILPLPPLLPGSAPGAAASAGRSGGARGFGVVAALIVGLGLPLAGCGSKAAPTFDLSAAKDFGRLKSGRGQLAVGEPTAVQALNSDRIIVKDGTAVTFLGSAQWADRVPALIQMRLIETFENGHRVGSVGRPNSALTADYLLSTELRGFQIEADSRSAVVEITARLLNNRGDVQAARVFRAEVPVSGSLEGANATQALDAALQQVLIDIARWVPV